MNPTEGTGQAVNSSRASTRRSTGSRGSDGVISEENVADFQDGLKSRLRKKFLLEDAFYVPTTELSVIDGPLDLECEKTEREEFNQRKVSCKDIFKGQTKSGDPIRTVVTKGVSGIGKTVLTQKLSLDWAEGRTNQDIQLLFLFTFRELTVLRDTCSLVELLHHSFSEYVGICSFENLRVLFIFDGLDERKLPLDFTQTRVLSDATECASMDVLLVNLIRGNLLPSARLWITTRSAAASQIPNKYVSMVTEMQGFTDAQRGQYFRKRFCDDQQATVVISHIRTSYSFYSMSHNPAVCRIISTVFQDVIQTRGIGQLPHTLTQLCIHFLFVQIKCHMSKECSEVDPLWTKETRMIVLALGELAFEQMQKGKLLLYLSEVHEPYIRISLAVCLDSMSKMYSQIFKSELLQIRTPALLSGDDVYCFNQCFQEFLAALYIQFMFLQKRSNLISKKQSSLIKNIFKGKPKLEHLLQSAVDQMLLGPDKNTGLFLSFVLGLSIPDNQSLLQGLMTQTGSWSLARQKTIKYIHKKLNKCLPIERRMDLFYCLSEMSDHGLLEEVKMNMVEARRSRNMSPGHWSALAFHILSSGQEDFHLRKYWPSEDALLNLLPVIQAYNTVILSHCNLSQKSCGSLSSVLCSSSLRHLDLRNNKLQDSGVKKLCLGLKSAHCNLETLILSHCNLSESSCSLLASVFGSSRLRHLDLSNNDLQDSGVKRLCSGLKSIPCRLETLKLSGCLISVEGGTALAIALNSHTCPLRELDVRYNHLGSSAAHLTILRDDPQCSLDTLRVEPAGKRWMILRSGLRKYSCGFVLDPNTCHCKLVLLGHYRRVTYAVEDLEHPPQHRDRFLECPQVLSSTGLTGRCYWEVEFDTKWGVAIAMSYKGIRRSGSREDCEFGGKEKSWCLRNINGHFSVCHSKKVTKVQSSFDPRGVGVFMGRVGVFLDSEAGFLSFYEVRDCKLSHLYTFTFTFTEPLFPGLGLGYGPTYSGESVSLVHVTPTVDCLKSRLKNPLSFFSF